MSRGAVAGDAALPHKLHGLAQLQAISIYE